MIVFKYPFNAKQNFIKRLIGLPGETVLIKRGDIFIKRPDEDEFQIARKPDHKLRAMLQLVDDTKYISKSLIEVGWPKRWQPWAADGQDAASFWTSDDDGHSYTVHGEPDRDIWLRYHHVVPGPDDWLTDSAVDRDGREAIGAGRICGGVDHRFLCLQRVHFDRPLQPEEISIPEGAPEDLPRSRFGGPSLHPFGTLGLHWVGDLALDSDVDIQSDSGELLLQLTKGGVAYLCRIDIATGQATLSISGGDGEFVAPMGRRPRRRSARPRSRARANTRFAIPTWMRKFVCGLMESESSSMVPRPMYHETTRSRWPP